MTAAILIVEDEPHIGEGLRDHLGRNGFQPTIAATLAAGPEGGELVLEHGIGVAQVPAAD